MRARVLVANVGRGNVTTTRRALRLVARALGFGLASFLLLQEVHDDAIDEPRFINRLLDRLVAARDRMTGIRRTFAIRAQPIFDRAPMLARTGRKKIEVYDGIGRVTAACWIACAYYRHRITRRHLAVLNIHLMHSPEDGGLKERLWDQGWAALLEEVHRLHTAGYDVVFGGDPNVRGWLDLPLKDLPPRAEEVARRGLDRIVAIPAPRRSVTARNEDWRPLPIEPQHGLLSVSIRFRRTRRRDR